MTYRAAIVLIVWVILASTGFVAADDRVTDSDDVFEKEIRPLFVERCHKCHSGPNSKGGLRLDSADSLQRGGDTGPAVIAGKPEKSLLIAAIQHRDGLKMPPNGKLAETQIAAIASWIQAGARWPNSVPIVEPRPALSVVKTLAPNEGDLAKVLQLWLRADSLNLADGEPVSTWPDQSGHGRDMSATKGIRTDGVGLPGKFARQSSLMKRPAVRFETSTGYASSPDNPVDLRGDAALTISVVMKLQPHESQPPFDGVVGVGNPAFQGDPGRPLAALVQINRGEDHALHFAGGWNHDASLGIGSFKPFYGKSIILTVTKQPGPMRTTTRMFINSDRVLPPSSETLNGSDTVPDLQHRGDIGAYLGKAVSWAGSIQGDIAEVLVYNKAFDDTERLGVEGHFAEKYGLNLRPFRVASSAGFSEKELGFWAYQPVRDVTSPVTNTEEWNESPVDRFVMARLEELAILPSPPAEKNDLLRRITFDLTGLPPAPEELDAFLKNESPQAFAQVVDRLLDSPHYGERWGRHWLDVVRYAETTANDANAVMRHAWRYRNYVIDAFNRDMSYDQFLTEQLAGDLLPPTESIETTLRRMIATGFLMVGPKALAETDKEQSRLDIVDDQIDVTGRAILGQTIACARCHDHKFDPIRTADYYAIAGIFRSTEPFQNEVRNATMWWEYPVPQASGEPIVVMAPKEALPRDLRIHLRGNRFTLGAIVPRGAIRIVDEVAGNHSSTAESAAFSAVEDSGRLELARWIVDRKNPLTARVMVNRIWQHHFGRGLVSTSDNFGARGDRPSHPELLDWLATRFMESGWSVKSLHRLIVLSKTYQQSVISNLAIQQVDAEGRWLSSFSRRRLSAEELRDSMLAVSGQLDRTPGTSESAEYLVSKAENIGAMIMPNRLATDDPIYTTFAKRSVYLPIVRNMLPDVLALFDAADPNGVTAVRNETTVASQSLFLLNSPFVREQSRAFAKRLLSDIHWTDDQRIQFAHRLALGRYPSQDELEQSRAFIAEYLESAAVRERADESRQLAAWQSFCQALLCSNEFIFVD